MDWESATGHERQLAAPAGRQSPPGCTVSGPHPPPPASPWTQPCELGRPREGPLTCPEGWRGGCRSQPASKRQKPLIREWSSHLRMAGALGAGRPPNPPAVQRCDAEQRRRAPPSKLCCPEAVLISSIQRRGSLKAAAGLVCELRRAERDGPRAPGLLPCSGRAGPLVRICRCVLAAAGRRSWPPLGPQTLLPSLLAPTRPLPLRSLPAPDQGRPAPPAGSRRACAIGAAGAAAGAPAASRAECRNDGADAALLEQHPAVLCSLLLPRGRSSRRLPQLVLFRAHAADQRMVGSVVNGR